MGIFINKGNSSFASSRRSEYVDKSGLIAIVNDLLLTRQRFICVTRSRRFGKTMAAEMLQAYYDHSCDSRELFADLEIASHPSFEQHRNKYPVIYIDMTRFLTQYKGDDIIAHIHDDVKKDVQDVYPDVATGKEEHLMDFLARIVATHGKHFILIVDEWDVIMREYAGKSTASAYLNLMRRMFKDVQANDVFACVYMTGILPIKKYKTESALNNFDEYSMPSPGAMARYFGFTKEEVRTLAAKHEMDFDDLEKWYDGYQIGPQPSMFNPNSVMTALREHWCESYWSKTGATDAVATYIQYNYGGLKDDILQMLAGGQKPVDPKGFTNDLSEIGSRDDVLTVLIHLGYLSYDRSRYECYIPNLEVAGEMENAVRGSNWRNVADALAQSRELLRATLNGDTTTVARMIDTAHSEDTSILSYNNENSMACVLSIAYFAARNDYIIHREYATGRGFADLVMIPRKNVDSPALVIELKYKRGVRTAIGQIKKKNYPQKVAEYTGDMLLVAISYDKNTKQHSCRIERWQK